MVAYSGSESEVTGLKTGRGEITDLALVDLPALIFEGQYDILRLKINAGLANVFLYLENLGTPFNINSILLRNSYFFNEAQSVPEVLQSAFSFETLHSGNVQALDKVFNPSIEAVTGMVYPSWLQDALIEKPTMQRAALEYARSFAYGGDGKMGWLIKYNNEYIGYNLGRKTGTDFEGILIGVLPQYRNKGAASYVYEYFINHVFREMNIGHFFNDIQVQNYPSMRSTFKENIVPSATWINVTLFPLLSYRTEQVEKISLDVAATEEGLNRYNEPELSKSKWFSVAALRNKNAPKTVSFKKLAAITNGANV
ncbi:MAG TPA: GNAT family N-acetyltransferase, partial [Chitinophagales bacterium]|nr:GNAT family N-acetyltransferase [Chitinophagales bacterium]